MRKQQSFFSERPLFVLDHNSLDILDVNDCATEYYGYSHGELLTMNIYDLGQRKNHSNLVENDPNTMSSDSIWIQQKKEGDTVYTQFTFHVFNYRGTAAKMAVAHDVTEQIKEQEKDHTLFPKSQLYRGDHSLAEILWDVEDGVKKWSNRAETLFGWRREDTIGNTDFFESFILDDELEQARQNITENIEATSQFYSTLGRVVTKSGEILICEWHNTLKYDESGDLETVHSLVQDVSERKEAEYLYKALSEKSLVGIYLIQDAIFKYVNPRLADIFGYSKDELEYKLGSTDLVHPDDVERVSTNLKRRMAGEIDELQYDFRCITNNRETIHVKVYGTRINYKGKPAVVGTLLDITNNKLAFQRYQASVESFEDLFDSISDAIYIQDKDQKFIKVNDAAVELNGYDREFLLGNTPDNLAAPGKVNAETAGEYFTKALNGTPQKFEQWGMRKNGEVFPEQVILKPATYFGEEVVIAIARDVSDRHEVEDEIQKSREKFSQLFQNAPVGIVMMDDRQEIRTVNRAFEQIFGYKEAEIQGLDLDRVIVPEEQVDEARSLSGNIFEGRASSATATRRHKDGSHIEVIVYGVPVTFNDRTIAIFGIYVDITERIKAERKVKKSLQEKEVLLAEIHHRVKNNLAVITGLLELQHYNTTHQEAKDVIKESQLRVNSIALIHEKLYQNEDLSEISIDVYLDELIDIIKDSMGRDETDVAISIESESVCLTINQAIPCGLILNELITNSYKHAFKDRKSGEICIQLEQMDDEIVIVYKDSGKGMPDDINMDNPGTLGLTLLSTLSDQLQGQSQFQDLEIGMCFKLAFPID